MRSVFGRTWLALLVAVGVSLLALHLWGTALRDPQDPVRRLLSDGPPLVATAFEGEPDDAARLRRVEEGLFVHARFGDPLVPPPARQRLRDGFPVPMGPGGPPGVWIPTPDGRVLGLTAPPPGPPPLVLLLAAVTLGSGLAAAWQLRPVDRALERLSAAAERMGRGDLDVRTGLTGEGPAERLGRRFDEMAARLSALIAGRTELLQAVSHELRTPLQRLRMATELLTDERADAAERRALADRVERDLDELDALVAELLAWGRSDAGPLRPERVAVDEVLAEAAQRARGAGATDVAVAASGLWIRADATVARRAVGNLAENAARHGRGRVRLAARAAGAQVEVLVDDDGPGVPAADRDRVFEPFVRLDPARGGGGTGLGLAIVARAAAAHGGRVAVEEGGALGGARFCLALPAADAP